jgi:hypothetical protein
MRRRAVRCALLAAGAAAGVAAAAGCGAPTTRDVRATILDEQGEPVPGAVFYAEAYDEHGPFAFLSARAGTAGEVPDTAREPLKLAWKGGAKVALAAFAEGYRPAVLRDPAGYVESDGALLVLVRGEEADPAAVADLGFPFAGRAELAAQAAAPEHDALRLAFTRARANREEKTLEGVDAPADS